MASVGAAANSVSATEGGKSARLLVSLQEAHADLLAAMDAVEQVTRLTSANRAGFTSSRWQISRASMARRAIGLECFHHLRRIVDADSAQALDAFNADDFDLLSRSAAHVARWPADAIEREWPAYCEASRAIRARMSIGIDAQQRLLYPLLRRDAELSSP